MASNAFLVGEPVKYGKDLSHNIVSMIFTSLAMISFTTEDLQAYQTLKTFLIPTN